MGVFAVGLELHNAPVIVIGSNIREDVVARLVHAEAVVTVVEAAPNDAFRDLLRRHNLTVWERSYDPEILDSGSPQKIPVHLVIAASSDPTENLRVARDCQRRRILVSGNDLPSQSTFYVGADLGDSSVNSLRTAMVAGIRDPRRLLVPRIKPDLEEVLDDEKFDAASRNAVALLKMLERRLKTSKDAQPVMQQFSSQMSLEKFACLTEERMEGFVEGAIMALNLQTPTHVLEHNLPSTNKRKQEVIPRAQPRTDLLRQPRDTPDRYVQVGKRKKRSGTLVNPKAASTVATQSPDQSGSQFRVENSPTLANQSPLRHQSYDSLDPKFTDTVNSTSDANISTKDQEATNDSFHDNSGIDTQSESESDIIEPTGKKRPAESSTPSQAPDKHLRSNISDSMPQLFDPGNDASLSHNLDSPQSRAESGAESDEHPSVTESNNDDTSGQGWSKKMIDIFKNK